MKINVAKGLTGIMTLLSQTAVFRVQWLVKCLVLVPQTGLKNLNKEKKIDFADFL